MKILPNKAYFSKSSITYIQKNFKKILEGKSFLSQYKFSEEFEGDFSRYIESPFALSCNSGTSALEIIFRTLGVFNKEVILPSNTFLATALGVINAGGKIKFADCNNDMCISYESIKKNLTNKTKAIVVVHIGGIITKDINKIKNLCKKNNIYLIEDAAQAHGSRLGNINAGNFGDFAAFSFYSTKTITTGEGGMITFKNKKYLSKMKSIREFGKVKKGIYINNHEYFGYNWRFQEVNALMGIAQLRQIEKFINKRTYIANIYYESLKNKSYLKIINPFVTNSRQNFYKFIVILKDTAREKLHSQLLKYDINLSGYVYEIPLHKQPIFKQFSKNKLPNTEYLCANHICLPIYYEMSKKQALFLVKKIEEIFEK
ncbi:DegT/DnrJ/EryC1/StrS family aminotransferase [Alphaproteobacteria bacterium]|nr:DegT/DnrJ/EryC1/StrS family aminotransferase [Alphaproteobacteria bacterium]